MNAYEYAGNNPVNEFDPSGFDADDTYGNPWNPFADIAGAFQNPSQSLQEIGQVFEGEGAGAVNFVASTAVGTAEFAGGIELQPDLAAELSHPVNMCSEAGQYGDFVGSGLLTVGSFFTGAGEEEAAVDAENIIQKCEGGGCFVAGTMVHMADGSWKRIEDVKVGDKVLSRNSQTGQDEVETVEHTFIFYKQATLVLKFADGNRIETTAD